MIYCRRFRSLQKESACHTREVRFHGEAENSDRHAIVNICRRSIAEGMSSSEELLDAYPPRAHDFPPVPREARSPCDCPVARFFFSNRLGQAARRRRDPRGRNVHGPMCHIHRGCTCWQCKHSIPPSKRALRVATALLYHRGALQACVLNAFQQEINFFLVVFR